MLNTQFIDSVVISYDSIALRSAARYVNDRSYFFQSPAKYGENAVWTAVRRNTNVDRIRRYIFKGTEFRCVDSNCALLPKNY